MPPFPPMRHLYRIGFVLTAALILHWPDALGSHVAFNGEIEIGARPLAFALSDPARSQFGRLTLLSALELDGPRGFGGISDLLVTRDGSSMLAISDSGHWIGAKLVYAGDRLTDLREGLISSVRDRLGAPLTSKEEYDAEGLASLDGPYLGKHVLVSFERNHRLVAYDLGADGMPGRAGREIRPPAFRTLPGNGGIEALAAFTAGMPLAGKILAVAERNPADRDHHQGWLIDPAHIEQATQVAISRSDQFDATDLAVLPDGDVLLLERRYTPFLGAAMRLRLLAAAEIASGQPVEGTLLLDADAAYAVDNMEALATHQDAEGRTIITIMSDDNFNSNQRTLLLQFRLD